MVTKIKIHKLEAFERDHRIVVWKILSKMALHKGKTIFYKLPGLFYFRLVFQYKKWSVIVLITCSIINCMPSRKLNVDVH